MGGMSAMQYEPAPVIERSFAAVQAALPAENAAAFNAQFAEIARAEVPDMAAVDKLLTTWHGIASMIAADPADWKRVNQLADDLQSGKRHPGRDMADVLAEHGVTL